MATISRFLKIIGLFCKTALLKRLHSAKETYNVKEPTNRSHSIVEAIACVTACCSVLQCASACCKVLQRVAVCRSVLQRVAVCCCVLQSDAVCCCVLLCAVVCCSMLLWCAAVCCSNCKRNGGKMCMSASVCCNCVQRLPACSSMVHYVAGIDRATTANTKKMN